MVAVTGAFELLIALKAGTASEPLAARPMEGILFVQVYTALLTVLLYCTALLVAPLHRDCIAGCAISGVGLTVMLNV